MGRPGFITMMLCPVVNAVHYMVRVMNSLMPVYTVVEHGRTCTCTSVNELTHTHTHTHTQSEGDINNSTSASHDQHVPARN